MKLRGRRCRMTVGLQSNPDRPVLINTGPGNTYEASIAEVEALIVDLNHAKEALRRGALG